MSATLVYTNQTSLQDTIKVRKNRKFVIYLLIKRKTI